MPHVRDSNTRAEAQANFAQWVLDVLAAQKAEHKRSKSAVARLTGVHRNDFDRWIKKETFPLPQTVRKFCDALGLDYSEPARILGWSPGAVHTADPKDLTAFIRRAKALAEHPGTSDERRRVLEERIRTAEQMRQTAANNRLTAEQMDRTARALLEQALGEDVDTDR